MENKQKKCIKGKSCLYCGTTYCQFVDELNQLNPLKEQIKFQHNFIDSLLKATNNSEWLDKSILDDEAGEIIEKIELDYVQLEQLEAYKMEAEEGKEINAELKAENEELKNAVMLKCPQCGEIYLNPIGAKLYETLTEIKEICKKGKKIHDDLIVSKEILQKISECEVQNGNI